MILHLSMTSVWLEQLISLFCKSDTARHRLSSEVFSGRRVGAHELGFGKAHNNKNQKQQAAIEWKGAADRGNDDHRAIRTQLQRNGDRELTDEQISLWKVVVAKNTRRERGETNCVMHRTTMIEWKEKWFNWDFL